jgi:zinc protease
MPDMLRVLAALIFSGMLLGAPATAQSGNDWAPQSFTLSNGMRAVVLPDHRAPVVTHMVWYRVGSADEVRGKSGLAHFLEHLMFKATKDRPAGEFSKTVARNGGQDNAGTSFDFTNYHFRVAKDRLPLMMRMEADRMVNLQLADEEVLPERGVVQEERRQSVDSSPEAILDEMIYAKVFAGHPYAVPVIGYMDDVAKLTRADAVDWYRTWYGPENAILVVAGDMTAAELKPLAEAIYGDIPRRGNLKVRAWPPVKPITESVEVTYRDPKVRQTTWSRTWLGVPMGHPDVAALQVGMEVLAGGRTSRFYRELVEGGKAVMAYGHSSEMEAAGTLAISLQPSQGMSVEAVRASAMLIVNRFLDQGPTPAELDRAKSMLAAEAVFRRDNQMDMANWYGGQLTAGLTLDAIAAEEARIASVSAADVKRAMNRYLRGPRFVDGLLAPESP